MVVVARVAPRQALADEHRIVEVDELHVAGRERPDRLDERPRRGAVVGRTAVVRPAPALALSLRSSRTSTSRPPRACRGPAMFPPCSRLDVAERDAAVPGRDLVAGGGLDVGDRGGGRPSSRSRCRRCSRTGPSSSTAAISKCHDQVAPRRGRRPAGDRQPRVLLEARGPPGASTPVDAVGDDRGQALGSQLGLEREHRGAACCPTPAASPAGPRSSRDDPVGRHAVRGLEGADAGRRRRREHAVDADRLPAAASRPWSAARPRRGRPGSAMGNRAGRRRPARTAAERPTARTTASGSVRRRDGASRQGYRARSTHRGGVASRDGAHHRRRRAARRPARRSGDAGREPARPAPHQPLAGRREPDRGRDRGAGRPPDRADRARRGHRRRGHPGRAAGARSARGRSLQVVALDSRRGGPGGGRRVPNPAVRSRAGPDAARRATGARCPTPTARSTSSTPRWCSITCPRSTPAVPRARWPASRGSGSSSTTSSAAGWAGSARG